MLGQRGLSEVAHAPNCHVHRLGQMSLPWPPSPATAARRISTKPALDHDSNSSQKNVHNQYQKGKDHDSNNNQKNVHNQYQKDNDSSKIRQSPRPRVSPFLILCVVCLCLCVFVCVCVWVCVLCCPPPSHTAISKTDRDVKMKCSFEKNFRHSHGQNSTWRWPG